MVEHKLTQENLEKKLYPVSQIPLTYTVTAENAKNKDQRFTGIDPWVKFFCEYRDKKDESLTGKITIYLSDSKNIEVLKVDNKYITIRNRHTKEIIQELEAKELSGSCYKAAKKLMESKKYDQVVDYCDDAITFYSQNSNYFALKMRALLQSGRTNEFLKIKDKWSELNPFAKQEVKESLIEAKKHLLEKQQKAGKSIEEQIQEEIKEENDKRLQALIKRRLNK